MEMVADVCWVSKALIMIVLMWTWNDLATWQEESSSSHKDMQYGSAYRSQASTTDKRGEGLRRAACRAARTQRKGGIAREEIWADSHTVQVLVVRRHAIAFPRTRSQAECQRRLQKDNSSFACSEEIVRSFHPFTYASASTFTFCPGQLPARASAHGYMYKDNACFEATLTRH
jgi:hypothetical protein